jgi:hypothetical protein
MPEARVVKNFLAMSRETTAGSNVFHTGSGAGHLRLITKLGLLP